MFVILFSVIIIVVFALLIPDISSIMSRIRRAVRLAVDGITQIYYPSLWNMCRTVSVIPKIPSHVLITAPSEGHHPRMLSRLIVSLIHSGIRHITISISGVEWNLRQAAYLREAIVAQCKYCCLPLAVIELLSRDMFVSHFVSTDGDELTDDEQDCLRVSIALPDAAASTAKSLSSGECHLGSHGILSGSDVVIVLLDDTSRKKALDIIELGYGSNYLPGLLPPPVMRDSSSPIISSEPQLCISLGGLQGSPFWLLRHAEIWSDLPLKYALVPVIKRAIKFYSTTEQRHGI